MNRIIHIALVLAVIVQVAGCSTTAAPEPRETVARVHVTSQGWHTSIVLARADLPDDVIPEAADFPESGYLEFGWGDEAFYQDKDPGVATTLRAGLWPTPSVLHVAGFRNNPALAFAKEDREEIPLDAEGFAALTGFIHGSFERGEGARADALGPGLSSNSRFYAARGNFHILYTCNTWTARALKDAGLDIDVGGAKFANSLMVQIRHARWAAR